MSDLLTTSAERVARLAGGSRRPRHGRRAEGIRIRAHVHPLLARCGQRKVSELDWTARGGHAGPHWTPRARRGLAR
eukprot:5493612-Pyramimonas_sp.AAC.1